MKRRYDNQANEITEVDMFKKIIAWANKPAKWYQFWLPQSSFKGGMVGGTIIIIVTLLFHYL